jgi:O-antigen/teichoic acid export membrane protein
MVETGAVLQGGGREPIDRTGTDISANDLKRSATRGAFFSIAGQLASFVLRTGSMVIMARLLTPKDFGLVGMVAAVTGFLGLFRDLGLSMATIQRSSVTREQTSTLFWINLAAGGILTLLCACLGPVLAAFYGEPRLLWITASLGTSFLFNGASAQHRAMLQREMRFKALAIIDIASMLLSLITGVVMALAGAGFWALVGAAVTIQAGSAVGAWCVTGWLPGPPRRRSGVRSMLKYGGTITLTNILAYIAYNADKVLLGRFWGAAPLGIYGRAYQLINLPTENLNCTIGQVAFPALSRVQNDPVRLRSYFLKGYGFFLSLVLPITIACGLFAEEIVHVFLGSQWNEAAPIFRLLAPTILAFAIVHPFGWLLQATGRVGRSLKISIVFTPSLILGYTLGLGHGPKGVALGFSIAILILSVPVVLWAKRGTLITFADGLKAAACPAISITVGVAAVALCHGFLEQIEPPLLRLVVENCVLMGVYLLILLQVLNQKAIYLGLVQQTGLWPFSRGKLKGAV